MRIAGFNPIGEVKITIKISVELLQKLVVQSADMIGPSAVQFVKLLEKSGILIDIDWEILAQLFTSSLHSDQIENICPLPNYHQIITSQLQN